MLRRAQFFLEGDNGGGSGGASSTLLSGASDSSGGSSQHSGGDPRAGGSGAPPAWNWTKEDGSFNEGWLDKLAPEIKGNPSLKVIGNLNDLAKSYIETKGLIGKKLEAPGENATPEQITAWRKTVGAPEKPEGYYGDAKTLRPDIVPEGMWDAASEKQFLEIAHKHHLPPAAVKEILGFYGQSIASSLQASKATEEQILQGEGTKLREAWGKEYDANLALASRVAQTLGLDPKTNAMFTSAEAVQAFAKMGKLLSEDRLVKGDASGINGSISEKIRDITDPQSTSVIAREYRGDFGPERQAAAQSQYHQLLQAQGQK